MAPASNLFPLIALTLLGIVAGVTLALFARRARRVDDHPTCRKCRFDLVGLGDRVEACPECGAALTAPRAVRVGNRRTNWGLVTLGALIVLMSLAVGGGNLYLRVAGVETNRYKPAWLLVREARAGSATAADKALAELSRRLQAGELGEERARELVSIALSRQVDPNAVWSTAWGDYLESAWACGKVTGEERAGYLLDGLSFALKSRGRLPQGQPIALQLAPSPYRLGNTINFSIGFELKSLTVGGVENELRVEGEFGVRSGIGSERWGTWPSSLMAPLGTQELTSVWTVQLKPNDPGVPAKERAITLTKRVTVVGKDEPTIELLDDKATEDRIVANVGVPSLRVTPDGSTCDYTISFADLPCQLIGKTVLREPNPPEGRKAREWEIGTHSLGTGTSLLNSGWAGSPVQGPTAFDLDVVDVVLVPSLSSALSSADVNTIWGKDVVIKGVKVERREPKGPKDP